MITFIKTINYAEEQSKYINLTDDQGRTYGHLFPDHKTRFIVIDHNGVQTHAQMHHRNQIWGDLRKWYLSTGAVEGDTVIVTYNPEERLDNDQVLRIGVFDPNGGKRQQGQEISSGPLQKFPTSELFQTNIAADIAEPSLPLRHSLKTYRILRDTVISRWLKNIYSFECQICGLTIKLANGERYAEVHHIQPLGSPHNGPDVIENMLVLCPNHHAMCDLGAIKLSINEIQKHPQHKINIIFVEYHNNQIAREFSIT